MRLASVTVALGLTAAAVLVAAGPVAASPHGTGAISIAEAVTRAGARGEIGTQACSTVYITSNANGGIVSAELGYGGNDYGMLRARATAIGPWEQFELCIGSTFDTLRSLANNLYVSAELGYGGGDYAMLRARAAAIGPWEQFIVGCSTDCYIYSLANYEYVSAELGYGSGDYAMLRARSLDWGAWESFR